MSEPAPDRLLPPGVALSIWVMVLTVLPALIVFAGVVAPPREFAGVVLVGDVLFWLPGLIASAFLISSTAKRWQRVVGIIGVALPVLALIGVATWARLA